MDDYASRIGDVAALDRVTKPLAQWVRDRVPAGPAKDLLTGRWLGHPVHPMLTDIPIGSFTSASFLDILGGKRARPAADALIGLGLLSAVPTVAAGLTDWSDTHEQDSRIGLVHAAANAAGLVLYGASFVARRRGQRVSGVALALAGMGVMTIGGYLGGQLGYSRGVGVNHAFAEQPPEDWTMACDDDSLVEGKPIAVDTAGVPVMLVRLGGTIHAIGDTCTHAGGPLHEGAVDTTHGCVTCPWHASVFQLDTGSVVRGPARVPAVAYDVRVSDGRVEIKAR